MNPLIYFVLAAILLFIGLPLALYYDYKKSRNAPNEKVGLFRIARRQAIKIEIALILTLIIGVIAIIAFTIGRISGQLSQLSP